MTAACTVSTSAFEQEGMIDGVTKAPTSRP